jgi:hypothetical protein
MFTNVSTYSRFRVLSKYVILPILPSVHNLLRSNLSDAHRKTTSQDKYVLHTYSKLGADVSKKLLFHLLWV